MTTPSASRPGLLRRLRPLLFWLHLGAGLAAGVVILVMCVTGAALAFEKEIVAWAERDVRRVSRPAGPPAASARPLDELLAAARAAAAATLAERGSALPASAASSAAVTVSADPRDAVAINFGRELPTHYVDPYTAAVRVAATTRTHDLLHVLEDWHRRLAATGEHRETGRAVTGAANAVFVFLGLSGLWLWWPRAWNSRALRPVLWFTRDARGRARDWNWHHVLGFWFLPVLLVLAGTGLVISYRWASDLPYRLLGETPPAPGAAAAPPPATSFERPPGAERLTFAALLAHVNRATPGWTEVTLREGLPPRRAAAAPTAAPTSAPTLTTSPTPAPDPAHAATATPTTPRPAGPRGPQPFSATVRGGDNLPGFATTQLVLHPFTGEVLSRSGYAEQSPGRRLRSWLRFLHTGEALGWPGQLIAALACLAGAALVYTGFALSWRRFFNRRAARVADFAAST